jgi:hypothetical protein
VRETEGRSRDVCGGEFEKRERGVGVHGDKQKINKLK